MHKSSFNASFLKLSFHDFLIIYQSFFFMSETTVCIYVNGTTWNLVVKNSSKIQRTKIFTHVLLTVTWALQIIRINYFTIHILLVWLTFRNFHLITKLTEIRVLQNWLITGVLFPNVCYRLGWDVSMKREWIGFSTNKQVV